MLSSPSIPNMGRRPSLADSIEVTIEQVTASEYCPIEDISAARLSQSQGPNLNRRGSLADSIEVRIESTTESESYDQIPDLSLYTFPSTRSSIPTTPTPPPAYTFPSLSQSTLSSTMPSAPSPKAELPVTPPSYSALPRTSSETFFWLGFGFPPFWLVGTARIWLSAIPTTLQPDHLSILELGSNSEAEAEREPLCSLPGEGSAWQQLAPSVAEAVALWRSEELLWGWRCANCLGGAVVGAGMALYLYLSVFR